MAAWRSPCGRTARVIPHSAEMNARVRLTSRSGIRLCGPRLLMVVRVLSTRSAVQRKPLAVLDRSRLNLSAIAPQVKPWKRSEAHRSWNLAADAASQGRDTNSGPGSLLLGIEPLADQADARRRECHPALAPTGSLAEDLDPRAGQVQVLDIDAKGFEFRSALNRGSGE